MKKGLILIGLITLFCIFPSKTFATSVTIQVDGKTIDVDNYIENNRTYVDIDEFCQTTRLCNVTFEKTVTLFLYHPSEYGYDSTIKPIQYLIEFNNKEVINRVIFEPIKDNNDFPLYVTNKKTSDVPVYKDKKSKGYHAYQRYVTLRFFATSMWYDVKWDGKNRIANISTYNPKINFALDTNTKQILATNGCGAPTYYVREDRKLVKNTAVNLDNDIKNYAKNKPFKAFTYKQCNGKFYYGVVYIG